MCGICGIINLQVEPPIKPEQIEAMNATLAHRGPDDAGVWVSPSGRAGLGNRRLAIIDLSSAGHQPMCNEDGTLWLVYNGEIYNFADLRSDLIAKGHQFRSHSDSEILLHLYEEYGVRLVDWLRGMFAFVLWDEKRSSLFAARDRVGIKPFYYARVGGSLLFASEIKALFASGLLKPALHRSSLLEYLALGHVSPPDTLFEAVHKLPPGSWLRWNKSGLHIQHYWDVFDGVEPLQHWREPRIVDQTLENLEQAVQMRLVADVPVGVFLSGGIDSSLVAALAARNTEGPIRTFTLGFRDHPEYNELQYARKVAGHLKAEPHEVLIGPEEIRLFFPTFLDYMEEPVMNPIWFAIYFVSQLARQNGVIVVLAGDGGDELYAGYNRWMEYLRLYHGIFGMLRRSHASLRQLAGSLGQRFFKQLNQREILRRLSAGEELFWGGTSFKADVLARMLPDDLWADGSLWERLPLECLHEDFLRSLGRTEYDPLEWMSYAAIKGDLLEDFLMRLDKMGMAASIEGRVPLLDHEFIRWSQSIPPVMKYPSYQNKRLLRQAAFRLLPRELIDRPKMGFCAPVEAWLAEGFGRQMQESLEFLQKREHVFRPSWFHSALSQPEGFSGSASANWSLLMLGQWYAHWMGNG